MLLFLGFLHIFLKSANMSGTVIIPVYDSAANYLDQQVNYLIGKIQTFAADSGFHVPD